MPSSTILAMLKAFLRITMLVVMRIFHFIGDSRGALHLATQDLTVPQTEWDINRGSVKTLSSLRQAASARKLDNLSAFRMPTYNS